VGGADCAGALWVGAGVVVVVVVVEVVDVVVVEAFFAPEYTDFGCFLKYAAYPEEDLVGGCDEEQALTETARTSAVRAQRDARAPRPIHPSPPSRIRPDYTRLARPGRLGLAYVGSCPA